MTITDIINDMPDQLRLWVMPALRILAALIGATIFEDGSMVP